jgi:hypothetical protein
VHGFLLPHPERSRHCLRFHARIQRRFKQKDMVGRGQIDPNTARTHGQKKHAAFGIFGKCFQRHFSFLQRHPSIQHAGLNVRRGQCDLDSMQRFFKRGKNQ